jgi:hypothetical protein
MAKGGETPAGSWGAEDDILSAYLHYLGRRAEYFWPHFAAI